MIETFTITLRVGLEGALAAVILDACLAAPISAVVRRLAVAAVGVGLALGVGLELAARARGLSLGEIAPDLYRLRNVHALGLVGAALLARGRAAADLAGGPRAHLAETVAFAAALGVLLPEGASLSARVREAVVLAEAALPPLAAAAAGLAVAGAAGAGLRAGARRLGVAHWLAPAAGASLLLGLELSGLAASAVEAHQLPAALTAAVSNAVHDSAHLVFVVLQIPDHAYLEDAVYQLILRFLEPELHAILTGVAVGAPLLAAAAAFLARPAPEVGPQARAPERRVARARHRRLSWAGAAPYALALVVTGVAVWQARPGADELYTPIPEPVVDDGAGAVLVPLANPLGDGADRMRKWVYADGLRKVTFFTIRRPDGSLAAALDLCEICQPKGYAQMGADHVFCIYCKTPIPTTTVGQPGGCNPVPIPSSVRGAMLLVPRDALLAAHDRAMADKR